MLAIPASAQLVHIEVRDIATDSLLHSVVVPDEVVHYLATGIYYTYGQTAYVIQTKTIPIKNNTTNIKHRPFYVLPSFKM